MPFDPQQHHRHSARLQGYDYSQAGAYFITLVTFQRAELFGSIHDGQMQLSRCGEIVREEWFASADIRKEIRLYPEEFVVMPNHVHGIVWIVDDGTATVGASGRSPLHAHPQLSQKSLGAFVAGFKSSVTKRIRDELNTTGIWQRNYYDRILRNERELDAIRKYIETNPLRWAEDEENPVKW